QIEVSDEGYDPASANERVDPVEARAVARVQKAPLTGQGEFRVEVHEPAAGQTVDHDRPSRGDPGRHLQDSKGGAQLDVGEVHGRIHGRVVELSGGRDVSTDRVDEQRQPPPMCLEVTHRREQVTVSQQVEDLVKIHVERRAQAPYLRAAMNLREPDVRIELE